MNLRSDLLEGAIALAIIALVAVMIAAVVLALSSAECAAKWERSGLKSSWSPLAGCMVQRKDGTWVPASAIRDLNQ